MSAKMAAMNERLHRTQVRVGGMMVAKDFKMSTASLSRRCQPHRLVVESLFGAEVLSIGRKQTINIRLRFGNSTKEFYRKWALPWPFSGMCMQDPSLFPCPCPILFRAVNMRWPITPTDMYHSRTQPPSGGFPAEQEKTCYSRGPDTHQWKSKHQCTLLCLCCQLARTRDLWQASGPGCQPTRRLGGGVIMVPFSSMCQDEREREPGGCLPCCLPSVKDDILQRPCAHSADRNRSLNVWFLLESRWTSIDRIKDVRTEPWKIWTSGLNRSTRLESFWKSL